MAEALQIKDLKLLGPKDHQEQERPKFCEIANSICVTIDSQGCRIAYVADAKGYVTYIGKSLLASSRARFQVMNTRTDGP